MATCLGKSRSFDLLRVPFRKLLSVYVLSYFPFEGRLWDLIESVPYHCLSFYFGTVGFVSKRKIYR